MRADFKVVLDACVLANYGVANLLLLLAEKPRLYLPVWSDEILAETRPEVHVSRWPNGGILFGPVVPPPQCGGT